MGMMWTWQYLKPGRQNSEQVDKTRKYINQEIYRHSNLTVQVDKGVDSIRMMLTWLSHRKGRQGSGLHKDDVDMEIYYKPCRQEDLTPPG